MNRHRTITEGSFCLLMMDTCTFLLEMVEWLEIHLGSMGMLRISKFSRSTYHVVKANSLLSIFICHNSGILTATTVFPKVMRSGLLLGRWSTHGQLWVWLLRKANLAGNQKNYQKSKFHIFGHLHQCGLLSTFVPAFCFHLLKCITTSKVYRMNHLQFKKN